jgi:hypothetical protein
VGQQLATPLAQGAAGRRRDFRSPHDLGTGRGNAQWHTRLKSGSALRFSATGVTAGNGEARGLRPEKLIRRHGGEVFASPDGGTTWQSHPLPEGATQIYALACG